MKKREIRSTSADSNKGIDDLLVEGWKPFAADQGQVYFEKEVEVVRGDQKRDPSPSLAHGHDVPID